MNKPDFMRRVPKSNCLLCGAAWDYVSPAGDGHREAGPNDITQCIKCAAVMALDDELRLRPLTDQEVSEIYFDSDLYRELEINSAAIRAVQAMRH